MAAVQCGNHAMVWSWHMGKTVAYVDYGEMNIPFTPNLTQPSPSWPWLMDSLHNNRTPPFMLWNRK